MAVGELGKVLGDWLTWFELIYASAKISAKPSNDRDLYNCSESVAKRMSAANVNLEDPGKVRRYLQNHAHSETREAVEKSDAMLAMDIHTGERTRAMTEKGFYLEAIASQYGATKRDIEEVVAAGIDLRTQRPFGLIWQVFVSTFPRQRPPIPPLSVLRPSRIWRPRRNRHLAKLPNPPSVIYGKR